MLCVWGIDTGGKCVLIDVCLGMRESEEDWLELGRGLTARGLRCPLMIVCDGAPGLNNAIEALWPTADRQRCTVHYADPRVMPTRGWKSPQIAEFAALKSA